MSPVRKKSIGLKYFMGAAGIFGFFSIKCHIKKNLRIDTNAIKNISVEKNI